jgi:plasmid stabilization system protein ParE
MIYNYFFEEKAQEEYEDALFWYLGTSEKVADNFIIAVDKTLELICQHPKRWRNEYEDYFELSLKKFPCKIMYWINEEKKLVHEAAVFHQNRNPLEKYSRKK